MISVHPTWKRLGFNGTDNLGKEDKHQYLVRIRKDFPNIPEPVLEQWIYLHHRNSEMQKLYGWIDYSKATFELVSWTTEQILEIKSFPEFEKYVRMTPKKYNPPPL